MYIFANSVVLGNNSRSSSPRKDENSDCKYNYDIVTDQHGVCRTKNPIKLTFHDHIIQTGEEAMKQNGLALARPTPKFVASSGVNTRHRFVFYCETDGPAVSCHGKAAESDSVGRTEKHREKPPLAPSDTNVAVI